MTMYFVSISLLTLGGLLAFHNLKALFTPEGPSMAPVLGGVFLFVGGLLYPGGPLRPWSWIGLFIDPGCMFYTVGVIVYLRRHSRRYAESRRLLCLNFETNHYSGSFSVYPEEECYLKWQATNGMAYGQILLQMEEFAPDMKLRLSIQEECITLVKKGGEWVLESETIWNLYQDKSFSLADATITEGPLDSG